MARQNVETTDSISTGFTKVNDNFTEVYTAGPVGSDVEITSNEIHTKTLDSSLVINANGTGIVDMRANAVKTNTLYVDILHVETNFNVHAALIDASTIDVGTEISSPSVISTTLLKANAVEANNTKVGDLTVRGNAVMNQSLTLHAGSNEFLSVTNGAASNPDPLFVVDGSTEKTTVFGKFRLPFVEQADAPDKEGLPGDEAGDVVVSESYIYTCTADYEVLFPLPQIWERIPYDNWL